MELTVEFTFSAAHHLSEEKGRCSRMHGHDYRLLVTVEGPVQDHDGMVMDFHDLDDVVEEVVTKPLDGIVLNEVFDVPTAERMAEWILDKLAERIPTVHRVTLYETPRYSVTLERPR